MSRETFEITEENFEAQVLQSSVPVLVDFTADWCPPCKMIAPYVDAIARKYAGLLRAGALDVDDHPAIMQRYGVMGLPTLILFQDAEPVQRIIGFKPQGKIEAEIVPHLRSAQA